MPQWGGTRGCLLQWGREKTKIGPRSIWPGECDKTQYDASSAYRGHDLKYEGMKIVDKGKGLIDS